ncbi:DUF2510 domain-containing protein [Mycobacterium angelicum]|uniref:DUF2510 domain-containing protein n=1 Tax=Mycobacterium angelicum TaxID=470074 RepID=A0A1W9ZWN3_MYCAN|nr:DUF2510 domain-containing protein [Mycobacterium angelicum]ORA22173.1 hypothetical protein BST12_10270 [Mycobacterium angelicum]
MSYPYQPSGSSGYPASAEVFQLRLIEHIGAVIFWQQRSYTVTGTLQQCEAAYRRAQTQNLLAGWWSLVSILVMNWIALFSNMSAMRRLRAMAGQPRAAAIPAAVPAPLPAPVPPGWYADPSGFPGQRYWDGAGWTHWTHPPSHR